MLPGMIPSIGMSAAGGVVDTSLHIPRSLRFRSGASGYLSRTPTVLGDQKKWTWAGWVKRSSGGVSQEIFTAWYANSDTGYMGLLFNNDQLMLQGWTTTYRLSNALYRDQSAWMFILCALDSANSTCKIEVNGVAVTSWATNNAIPNQSYAINGNGIVHSIGRLLFSGGTSSLFDGYIAECNFIDGQYLDSTSFGQLDAITGAWVAKAYAGTYGTNGFHLDFADNSAATATALGKDTSGNGNNWTPNNFSVTAGVTNDSLTDTPSNYGTDTGVGGEVRGNYATFNPLDANASATLSFGNMRVAGNAAAWGIFKTSYVASGKWYAEYTCTTKGTNYAIGIGNSATLVTNLVGTAAPGVCYREDATKFVNGVSTAYGVTYTTGDVIGIALDADAASVTFYKNGASQGAIALGFSGPFCIASSLWSNSVGDLNTGQRAFSNAAPSGFKALCTQNLPDPVIKIPAKYFDVNLRNGTGAVFNVTGKAFQPDLLWIKNRDNAYDHSFYDSVRGVQKSLGISNAFEVTQPTGVTAFNADGFTGGSWSDININSNKHIDWMWKKGVLPGLDIVNVPVSSNASVPHSLGVKPALIITKTRTGTVSWWATHKSITANMNDSYMVLNSTGGRTIATGAWRGEPTATVFYCGDGLISAGINYIAYLFVDIPGFSAFGSYTGNGSADGPFVWCGFKPRWTMMKRIDAAEQWFINDAARDPYNPSTKELWANTAIAEQDGARYVDLLSNGFKLRNGASQNVSGGQYIYAAFAEAPFKYARAR